MGASPPDPVRLFVALPVPEPLQAPMLAAGPFPASPWRWTAPERLHLTLSFLGAQPRQAVADIMAALAPLRCHAPLRLTVGSWLAFPHPAAARVLTRAVGLSEPLLALQATAVRSLHPWLPASAAGFRPHITLARSRVALAAPETALPPLDWTAGEVHLIESRLTSQGPEYRVLATERLGAETWAETGSESG